MSIRELKVLNYMMKGSIEYNQVARVMDMNLLIEAMLPDFKGVARIIRDYFNRYKSPPTYELMEDGLIDDLEEIEIILAVKDTPCMEGEYAFHIDKIKERYQKYLARTLAESIPDDSEMIDVSDFSADVIRIGAKIDRLNRNSVFAEGNIADSAKERLSAYKYVEDNPGAVSGVLTGFREIDEYIWGIKKQELMIIAGPSSSGKSMLMLNMAVNAWLGTNNPLSGYPTKTDGANVLYFTLEMSKAQTEQRVDACVASMEHKHLTRGMLTDQEKDRWQQTLKFQNKYDKRFYICDMPRGSKMTDIEARYETIIAEFEPDLVCIDYLGIMKPNATNSSDWLDLGYIAENMAEFARGKNIPVITASQRKARNKNLKDPGNDLEDLARSKMIGDNANIVLLIEKRKDEHLLEDMPVHIVKNRDGAKGEVKLLKGFAKSQILNLPDDWAEEIGDEDEV
jgi:replicative DNA helicase